MTMQQRRTSFDVPGYGDESRQTVTVFDFGMGLDFDTAPTNLKPGSTISADNWVMREGGMVPRPGTTPLGSDKPNVGGQSIRGGMDVVTSEASHFQTVSGSTLHAYLDPGSNAWSTLSWIAGPGGNAPNPATTFWWWTQSVRSDGSVVAFMAPTVPSNASGGAIQCWVPGTGTFSTVTGNIPAKALVSFSYYLIAWSTGTFVSGNTYIPYQTRVQWSDRGDPLNFVPGSGSLAGAEDLLAARGAGTGAAVLNDRVILFTTEQIWEGVEANVPGYAQFFFLPRDTNVGCRVPQTIQTVPEGILFMGNDNYLYLLPKEGGVAQVVDKRLAQVLRNTGASWAVYNTAEHRYELYTGVVGTSYTPNPPAANPTAEADNVSATTVGSTTATIQWTNVSFAGDETLEIWLQPQSPTPTWGGSVFQQVAYNGLTTQSTVLTGLTPSMGYVVGIRARNSVGAYTMGYSGPPDTWVPSDPVTIDPFSSVFTTISQPGTPLDLAYSTTDYSSGGKNYQQLDFTWSNTLGVPGVSTQFLKGTVNPPTTVVATLPYATTSYTDQQLLTPFTPLTTYYYAVRHVDTSGSLGELSNIVSYVNNGAA